MQLPHKASILVHCNYKLALLAWLAELGRRYPAIAAVAAHPGITESNLTHALRPGVPKTGLYRLAMKTEQGALSLLRAATEPGLATGEYVGPWLGFVGYPSRGHYRPAQARNETLAASVWAIGESLTGVKY